MHESWGGFTVSIFTEAASLEKNRYVSKNPREGMVLGWSVIPAIVVIAVNVEDPLALDTQNSSKRVSGREIRSLSACKSFSPRQNALSQAWRLVSKDELPTVGSGLPQMPRVGMARDRGVGGGSLPVPSTTTSYSGAISSMVGVYGGLEGVKAQYKSEKMVSAVKMELCR